MEKRQFLSYLMRLNVFADIFGVPVSRIFALDVDLVPPQLVSAEEEGAVLGRLSCELIFSSSALPWSD